MNRDLYLEHHGVKGMHWGVRRYQNEDGTLTKTGKKRNHENLKKVGKAAATAALVGGSAIALRKGHVNVKNLKKSKAIDSAFNKFDNQVIGEGRKALRDNGLSVSGKKYSGKTNYSSRKAKVKIVGNPSAHRKDAAYAFNKPTNGITIARSSRVNDYVNGKRITNHREIRNVYSPNGRGVFEKPVTNGTNAVYKNSGRNNRKKPSVKNSKPIRKRMNLKRGGSYRPNEHRSVVKPIY